MVFLWVGDMSGSFVFWVCVFPCCLGAVVVCGLRDVLGRIVFGGCCCWALACCASLAWVLDVCRLRIMCRLGFVSRDCFLYLCWW